MRNLLNPKWLFVINTLPVAVLFALGFGQFDIIKTLLDKDTVRLWEIYGLALAILAALNFIYAVFLTLRQQKVSAWYGVIALFGYISFIYLYGFHLTKFIPFNVPQWMISDNIFVYVGTFLMPTLAYSLLVLTVHFTPENQGHKAWVSFLIAAGIPVSGYLFAQIVLPVWQPVYRKSGIHAMLVLLIVAVLLFLFFLVRGIFILATKKTTVLQKYQPAWKIPIAIVFPLLGLFVNNGFRFGLLFSFSDNYSGIFGDFNNYWFYILAVVNGILICLPNLNCKNYRLFLFIGRSITFAYTFYFFLVLLPFLPLSVVAVIAVGAGVLMLAPLLLFVIHTNELSNDFSYLKTFFSKKILVGILLSGFWVIPAFVTAAYLKDKCVLNEALAYLYSPDYSKKYDIDKTSLQKTIREVMHHKDKNNDVIIGSRIPYLSAYFNWLVLDNLTLSDTKINYIETVFFGYSSKENSPEIIRDEGVEITNISARSTYDKSQNAWKSQVDLEITETGKNIWTSEYATVIDLPAGCWISDYYLYIGNRKETGILAEKKTAMWVFSNIRNENRDPGILHYLTGNKVAFRVFPFSRNEVRKTGIEFLHKEPVKLTIDNHIIQLGNAAETANEKTATDNVVYVSAQQKQTLKTVQRKPYFHFLVDVSDGKSQYVSDFAKRIAEISDSHKSLAENAQISFVNTYVNTFPLDKSWKKQLQAQTFEGGFFLERAINTALFNAFENKSCPVIVVVTDSIRNAVLDKDFSDFQFAFPESNLFFNLRENGTLQAHSLTEKPKISLSDSTIYAFGKPVLEYKLSDNSIAYLPDNGAPSIVLKNTVFEIAESEINEKNWLSALKMQAKWTSQILHPEKSDKEWLTLVKYSFISKIMTPLTSYLVVENEAQKAILQKKQAQVLAGNPSLDLDENTQQMSEPNLWTLAVLLGLVIGGRRRIGKLIVKL